MVGRPLLAPAQSVAYQSGSYVRRGLFGHHGRPSLAEDPCMPLAATWHFLPAKVATQVCDHKDRGTTPSITTANALAAEFFIKLLSTYKQ